MSLIIADIIEIDHFADIGEAEADALGAQDPGEPGTITFDIDARQPVPLWRDQPLVLVKAERARGYLELLREIGDGEGFAALLIRRVYTGLRKFAVHDAAASFT